MAIDAAQGAFAEWAAVSPRARGEVLRKAYDLMVGDGERLARIITLENGKSLADARAEVAYAAEFFRWNAEEAVRIVGQMSTAPSSGARSEEHTSELQSLMRISYAVFCLKKK